MLLIFSSRIKLKADGRKGFSSIKLGEMSERAHLRQQEREIGGLPA